MSASRPAASKPKKPPACDQCKARRVICFPTTDGTPCPRCIEGGVSCSTTPVVRKKPTRKQLPPQPPVQSTSNDFYLPNAQAAPLENAESGSVPTTAHASPDSDDGTQQVSLGYGVHFTGDLALHLIQVFVDHVPLYRHPINPIPALRKALAAVGNDPARLPPQSRVYLLCVCSTSALLSTDERIVGPGAPSLQSLGTAPLGTDLRHLGRRRQATCAALRAEALRLAREYAITVDVSEENAASCFILSSWAIPQGDETLESTARAFGSSYVSHVRSLAETWEHSEATVPITTWASIIMHETLHSVSMDKPILFTASDQLLICGAEPPETLEQMANGLRDVSKNLEFQTVTDAVRPFSHHVTNLARTMHDTITGTHPRRQPLDEGAVVSMLSQLSILETLLGHLLDRIEFLTSPDAPRTLFPVFPTDRRIGNGTAPLYPRMSLDHVLDILALTYSRAFAVLTLPLYRELRRRQSVNSAGMASGELVSKRSWDRLEGLVKQSQEMARQGARTVAKTLNNIPSLPHISHLGVQNIKHWVDTLLEEAQETVPTPPEVETALKLFANTITLCGFSYSDPRLSTTLTSITTALPSLILAPPPAPAPQALTFPTFPNAADLLSPPTATLSSQQMEYDFSSGPAPSMTSILPPAPASSFFTNEGLPLDDWFSSAMMGWGAADGMGGFGGGMDGSGMSYGSGLAGELHEGQGGAGGF